MSKDEKKGHAGGQKKYKEQKKRCIEMDDWGNNNS